MPRRCRGCYQNVELHAGCSVARAVVMGETFERHRWNPRHGGRCPDCSTIANGYHHVGCPSEPCPRCDRVGCGCQRPAIVARPPQAPEPYEAELGTREKVE